MALVTVPTIFRSVRRIREPVVEPVSLFEAKEHLRLMSDFADDDAYIQGLISAARRLIENRTRRTFTLTRWQATFSNWTGCDCHGRELPYPPLMATIDTFKVEIEYRDHDRYSHLLDADLIRPDTDSFPGRVHLTGSIPSACCNQEGVIRWWAGVELPSQVPEEARVAIKMMVAHWYQNRTAVTTEGAGTILPMAVDSLCASISWSGAF